MLKNVCLSLLCVGTMFTTMSIAGTHLLSPNLKYEFDLIKGIPETFKNPMLFTINATCAIQTPDKSDVVHARVVSKVVKVNDHSLNVGDEIDVLVKNGDTLSLSAVKMAEIELTNQGENTIKAVCTPY